MFLHKFRRTFTAMFRGWVALCLLLPFLAGIVCWMEDRSPIGISATWLIFAVFSIPVILIAWLFIFLPVDCAVPELSRLRRPRIAAPLGALFGMLPFFLLGTWDRMTSFTAWWAEVQRCASDPGAWVYMIGAAIVGFTAALHISRRTPSTKSQIINHQS